MTSPCTTTFTRNPTAETLEWVQLTVVESQAVVEELWKQLFQIIDAKNGANLGHRLMQVYKTPYNLLHFSYEELYNCILPCIKNLIHLTDDPNSNHALMGGLNKIGKGLHIIQQMNDESLKQPLLSLQAELLGLQAAFIHQKTDNHGLKAAFDRLVDHLPDSLKQRAIKLEELSHSLKDAFYQSHVSTEVNTALEAYNNYCEVSKNDMNDCSRAAAAMTVYLFAINHLKGAGACSSFLEKAAKTHVKSAEWLTSRESAALRDERLANVAKQLQQALHTCIQPTWKAVFDEQLKALQVIHHRFTTVMQKHPPLLPHTLQNLQHLLGEKKPSGISQPGYLATVSSWFFGT